MIESTLEDAAALVLLAAWRALPLLAIALLVDLGLRRRLAAHYHAYLWTLVVLRLLLPFSIATPFSVHGPIDRWTVQPREHHSPPPTTANDLHLQAMNLLPANAPLAADERQAIQPQPLAAAEVAPETVILLMTLAVWLLAAGAVLLRACVAHVRFAMRLRHCRERTDPAIIDLVLRECDDMQVRLRPRLKEVPGFATPAVFGLLRATICLPPGLLERLEPQAFRWVLRHELAHLRRYDTWILSLATIMRAVHWFNPCAWLVVSKLRTRAEQAADELALRGASIADTVAYGRLLLEFAESGEQARATPVLGFVPFISGFSSGHGLRRRIDRLTHPTPQPGWALYLMMVTAFLLVAGAGLTDAQQSPAAEPEIRLPDFDEIIPVVSPPEDAGPVSIRSYDVAALLAKLRKSEPDADIEQSLILYANFSARKPTIADGQMTVEATEEQHRATEELLEALARSGPQQIATELRVLKVDRTLATPFEWKVLPVETKEQRGDGPVLFTQIEEKQLGELVRAAVNDHRCNILCAPKVTTLNGQTATIMTHTRRPFITGVVPAENGGWRPRVQTIDDGFTVKMRSVVNESGAIELSFDLKNSKIGEVRLANLPIRVAAAPQSPESFVTLQVPTVRMESLQMTAKFGGDESLLIALPRSFDPHGGQEAIDASATIIIYAVTPRKIPGTDRLE